MVDTVGIGGKLFIVMNIETPEGNWMGTCPAEGDRKWWANTREELFSLLESYTGVSTSAPTPAPAPAPEAVRRPVVSLPMATLYSDGLLDLQTPWVRFKFQVVARNFDRDKLPMDGYPLIPGELVDDFVQRMCTETGESVYFDVSLEKARYFNVDGTHVDVEYDTARYAAEECEESIDVLALLDKLIWDTVYTNPLLDQFRSLADGDCVSLDLPSVTDELKASGQTVIKLAKAIQSVSQAKLGFPEADTDDYLVFAGGDQTQKVVNAVNSILSVAQGISK